MAKRNLTFKLGLAALPALLLVAGWSAWRFLDAPTGVLPADPGAPAGEEIGGEAAPGGASLEPLSEAPAPAETAPTGSADLSSGEHSIEGRVLDPTGEPAPGAVVILLAVSEAADATPGGGRDRGKPAPDGSRVSSSAEGAFRFAGMAPGLYRLAARSEGHLPAVSGVIAIDAERGSAPVELRLRAAASLRGTVSTPDGSPVKDGLVRSFWRSRPPGGPGSVQGREEELLEEALTRREGEARSDAEGRFEIGGLAGGYHDLVITARGYGRAEIADAPTGDAAVRVVLRPELFFHGDVVDAEAKPVSGAEVSVSFLAADADPGEFLRASGSPPESRVVSRARTGADGKFAFGELAAGAYGLQVECQGYQQAQALIAAVPESEEKSPLVIRLEQGHRLGGTVRSPQGAPLAGASLRARYLRPISSPGKSGEGNRPDDFIPFDRENAARARADGSFQFTSLAPGIYRLEVSAKGSRGRVIENVSTDGEPLEIEISPAVPLELLVIDGRAKTPIAGASVTYRSAEEHQTALAEPRETPRVFRTDEKGRLRIDDFPEDHRAMVIEAEGYRSLATSIETGEDRELTIALDRGGSVSGRVQSSGGTPVEGLRVSLIQNVVLYRDQFFHGSSPDWDSLRAGPSGSTGPGGWFRIPLGESGSYRVLVEGRPYVPAVSEVIEVSDPGAEVEGIDLELKLSGTVRGRVVDGAGFAVPGAQAVVLADRSGGDSGRGEARSVPGIGTPGEASAARADATGAFEVSGLALGRFRVIASAPGYLRVRSEVFELAPGGTAAVELVLGPEMEIAGTVLSPEGDPVAAARIRALPKGEGNGDTWREERTLSTTPGTFRLGRLANASYDMRVDYPRCAPALLRDIPAGSRDVEVRLERTVGLSGKVAGTHTGDPVTEFVLSYEPEENRLPIFSDEATFAVGQEFRDPQGAFVIEGLAPGRYLVRVRAREHLDSEAMVLELPPNEGLADVVIPAPEMGLLAGTVFDGQARPLAGATVAVLRRAVDPVTGKFIFRRYWQADGAPGRGRREGREGRGGKDGAGKDAGGKPEYVSRERTGEDGRFWIRGLPDGVFRLSTSHDDFVTGETGDHAIEEGAGGPGAGEIAIYLDPGATLTGSVRWMSDVEGGALTVVLTPAGRETRGPGVDRRFRKSAAVDARGQFKILGLPVGDYFLRADFRRSANGTPASIRRTVAIQDPVREKHIVLDLSR